MHFARSATFFCFIRGFREKKSPRNLVFSMISFIFAKYMFALLWGYGDVPLVNE